MKEHIQAIVTILALVNPLMCAEFFANSVGSIPKREKQKAAIKAVTTIGIILLIAAIAGISILKMFGVSLDAFSCAGGGILVWIGASMLKSSQDKPETSSPENAQPTSLTQMILFAASPGTITGVITVAAAHGKRLLPITAITGVVVTLVVLVLVLLFSIRFSSTKRKSTMARKMVTSYMGVIVIAMGVQFILSGIKAFMS